MLSRAGQMQRSVMRAMWQAGNEALATDRDGYRTPARMGQRTPWRNTQRLHRDLDRLARVLAARDLTKARVQARCIAMPP